MHLFATKTRVMRRFSWVAYGATVVTSLFGCGPTNGSFNPNGPIGAGDPSEQCCSAPPPAGFIKVNDEWDPSKCGSPSSSSIRNVCTYQRYDSWPVGTTLQVCSSAPVPAGWVKVTNSEQWDPTRCGAPTSNTSKNVMQISRTS